MNLRLKRKIRIRSKIAGTESRPRLSVFRSNKNLFLQVIDDESKKTLASASTLKSKTPAEDLFAALTAKKIKKVVFDRSGYQYHGRIKEIAEKLRQLGLEF